MHKVHSIFRTLCGEGINAGRVAVFVRYSGCPLWTGTEKGRDKGGSCAAWCDTDFRGTDGPGGGKFKEDADLLEAVNRTWVGPRNRELFPVIRPLVVLTGGEPIVQVTEGLIAALKASGYEVALETSGSFQPAPLVVLSLNCLTVSPKAGQYLIIRTGTELKLIHPQPGADPADYAALRFRHFFMQPMWTPDHEVNQANTAAAATYCMDHPQWRLSVQMNKGIGYP